MRRLFRTTMLLGAVSALAGLAAVPGANAAGTGGSSQTYVVLYSASAVPSDAARSVSAAGGQLVAAYNQIGVVVARSANSSFALQMKADSRVEGASATGAFATRIDDGVAAQDTGPADPVPGAPNGVSDSLSGLQWDMAQIHAPAAHAVTGGSPAVRVGDIDTGLDYTHPDLAANVDFADSASCLSGAPDTSPAAWNDQNGHGTHTAGTIAAALNGIGIVGVAPNVKIAGIRAGNADGFFFPEAVICSFVWAGTHHLAVTNNSYFADPWQFNCRNDAEQRAIWKAEQRAIRFAMSQGTTVVAAEGNESSDLSHPTIDNLSPDNTTPVTRDVTNACVVIPVEIAGVVGVTAVGHNLQDTGGYLKSFYSSYGASTADVAAPGGDSIFGTNAEAPNGRVLSTYPASLFSTCLPSRRVVDASGATYCYLQGTSMASPHVAGIAALVVSRYGSGGAMSPGAVAAMLGSTATPQPCPGTLPTGYLDFTQAEGGSPVPQSCLGGTGHNSWYGSGQADALAAVSR